MFNQLLTMVDQTSMSDGVDQCGNKRRKLHEPVDHDVHAESSGFTDSRISHSRDSYTVGWICPLALELTAARAMLDEEHSPLPAKEHDQNIYHLGSMCGHNVVIASLPSGIYGTSAAARVGAHLMISFPSITVPLLVGVGGGVPRIGLDIRLGDVAISEPSSESPAVVQYDLGKTGRLGLEFKGSLNNPRDYLLKAVSTLKSNQDLGRIKVQAHIDKAITENRLDVTRFGYPGWAHDVLRGPGCDHEYCQCDEPVPICRPPRPSSNPMLHFGTIASGNQVIKDAHTRDRLAKTANGAICFEMEAAGVMNDLRCLVIRGVSDYCDSYKHKLFQGYAALSAASTAKELLRLQPVAVNMAESTLNKISGVVISREQMMRMLNFPDSGARRAMIQTATPQTCEWLLGSQEYVDWLDEDEDNLRHHGLLWIKGNAGTGKSTLMKYAAEQVESTHQDDRIVISFFYNARGSALERSSVGMYRALLSQLVQKVPHAYELLCNGSLLGSVEDLSLERLERALEMLMGDLNTIHLVCLIDALDECPEDEVRQMVRLFERVCDSAPTKGSRLNVLFSSRHYPNISIDSGVVMILDKQEGHSSDIVKYIDAEFKLARTQEGLEFKTAILEKSSGIFLWVVLVVQILRVERDKGRLPNMNSLHQRLSTIPAGLGELFRDIITRDNHRMAELVLCFQWLLYAYRPITLSELYAGLVAGDEIENVDSDNFESISIMTMKARILDASKGLVQPANDKDECEDERDDGSGEEDEGDVKDGSEDASVTGAGELRVQFIHESVREFLLESSNTADLFQGFELLTAGPSHDRITRCCNRLVIGWLGSRAQMAGSEGVFSPYATRYVLKHANQSERYGITQVDVLRGFNYRILQEYLEPVPFRYNPPGRLDEYLIKADLHHLLKPMLALRPNIPVEIRMLWSICNELSVGSVKRILQEIGISIELSRGPHRDFVNIMIGLLQEVQLSVDGSDDFLRVAEPISFLLISFGRSNGYDRYIDAIGSTLNAAAEMKIPAALVILLGQISFNIGYLNKLILLVAQEPVSIRNSFIVPYIFADGQVRSNRFRVERREALLPRIIPSLTILLENGADINTVGNDYCTPLLHAVKWVDSDTVQFLIDNHAQNQPHSLVSSTIQQSVLSNNYSAFETLQQGDVDISSPYEHGATLLHLASLHRDGKIVQKLLRTGVHVDPKDYYGETPLVWAARSDNTTCMSHLIAHGANLDAYDNNHDSVLHKAVMNEAFAALQMLLQSGAKTDAMDKYGNSLLFALLHFTTWPSDITENTLRSMRLLLHKGMQLENKNADGLTILQVAALHGDQRCAELLYNHGATIIPCHGRETEQTRKANAILSGLQHSKRSEACCEMMLGVRP